MNRILLFDGEGTTFNMMYVFQYFEFKLESEMLCAYLSMQNASESFFYYSYAPKLFMKT